MSNKPKCGCGNTQNPDGFCDGSHTKQINYTLSFKLVTNFCFYYIIMIKVAITPLASVV